MPTHPWAREPSSKSPGIAARTPRCLQASMLKGWDHLWPWREPPPPECSRPTPSACWPPPSGPVRSWNGQPRSAQAQEDKGAHRGARMRALVSALILARSEPHRGSPLEDKAHPENDERSHQGCPDRGDGSGAESRERQRCTRLLCLLRLPNPGAATMKGAVSFQLLG